jgi:2'-5' RNA ligase
LRPAPAPGCDRRTSRLADAELASAGKELRIVPRENLHVTLAFLGSTPAGRLGEVVDGLHEACSGQEPAVLSARGYRETRSVAMIVLDDEGGRAELVAGRLFDALEKRGLYRREERKWLSARDSRALSQAPAALAFAARSR